jgi:hypothetical protein
MKDDELRALLPQAVGWMGHLFDGGPKCEVFTEAQMLAFGRIVAEKQKEKDAQICEDHIHSEIATGKVDHNEVAWTQYCAAAIRSQS